MQKNCTEQERSEILYGFPEIPIDNDNVFEYPHIFVCYCKDGKDNIESWFVGKVNGEWRRKQL
jgi:hypothetical protein